MNKINFNPNYYASVKLEEPENSFEVIKKMLTKNKKISAIICSTEFSALSAIKACNYLNYKIGKDISIITFDGPVVEALTNPKLTAISHPLEELGTNAIDILLGSKKKKLFSNYLVKPHIIERGSVKSLI